MNPFIQSFRLQVLEKNRTYTVAKTSDIIEGVITKYQKITDTIHFEQQAKVSVYYIPFIENILYKEIKSSGRDLLLYIIYNINDNTDFISLKLDKLSKSMLCSKPTLINAIKQLTDVGVICRKNQSEYWVNPHYIFKGNRLEFFNTNYPEYIDLISIK